MLCNAPLEEGPEARAMFVDTHFHLSWSARSKIDLNLKDCKSVEEVLLRVRREAERGGTYKGWVVGTLLPLKLARSLDRFALDEASPEVPVSLATRDGHMAVANTKALKLGGVSCEDEGAECEDGKLTGRLYESAMRKLRRVIPDPDTMLLYKAFKAVLDELKDGGVVEVHSMTSRWLEMEIVNKIKHDVKVYHYVRTETYIPGAVGVKLFVDGVIVHGTAMTEGKGRLYVPLERLVAWIKKGKEEGFQVAVHVMGDEALDVVLKAFKLAGSPKRVLRIEHAALVRDDQLEPLAEAGVPVSVQPGIMEAVGVEEFKRILGNRWKEFMRVKDMLEAGVRVYGGSDHPVGPWRFEEIKKYYKLLWRPPSEEEVLKLHTSGHEW